MVRPNSKLRWVMALKFDMVKDLVLDNGLGLGLTIPGGNDVDGVGINIKQYKK